MDASEYKAAREQLGLYNVELARKLAVNLRTAQRYESGELPIKETVARLIQMYLKHGIPKGW
jgi:ribosome-binding protein aMBF1 (putative translation factor)